MRDRWRFLQGWFRIAARKLGAQPHRGPHASQRTGSSLAHHRHHDDAGATSCAKGWGPPPSEYSAYIWEKQRADERTRTADLNLITSELLNSRRSSPRYVIFLKFRSILAQNNPQSARRGSAAHRSVDRKHVHS